MATITQKAQDALRNQDDYVSPEESLKYLNTPQNFQSFARYMERFIKNANIDIGSSNLGDYLSKIVLALAPTSETERRGIKRYFKTAFKTDVQGNSPKMDPIPRKTALKLCFALNLNVDESQELLRKACNTYGFNVRDAYEATCFYCILTSQNYSTVERLLEQYNHASVDEKVSQKFFGTETMNAVLSGLNWESNEHFLNDFLIPNKVNFSQYSKTTAQKYVQLRCSLCEQIIQWNLASYEDRNDMEKAESDELFRAVKKQINVLVIEDPDFADCAAEFSDITKAEDVLPKIEARLRVKYPASTQGVDRYSKLINESVSSRQLVQHTLWGIPFIFKSKPESGEVSKQGDFSPNGKSILNSSPLMDCFPGRAPFDTLDASPLEASKTLTARKIIILLYFMDTFFDTLCSEINYSKASVNPELAERQYNNFYTGLCNTLASCSMAYIYPADPFDWLILKSARALTQADKDSNPIEYFNDILRLSFTEYSEDFGKAST